MDRIKTLTRLIEIVVDPVLTSPVDDIDQYLIRKRLKALLSEGPIEEDPNE